MMSAEWKKRSFLTQHSTFITQHFPKRYLSVALSVGSHRRFRRHFAALALPSTVPCAARTFLAPASRRATAATTAACNNYTQVTAFAFGFPIIGNQSVRARDASSSVIGRTEGSPNGHDGGQERENV